MVSSVANLPLEPGLVILSEEEKKTGEWSRSNKQRIAELIYRDGLVVLQNVVDIAHLEALRDAMKAEAKVIKAQKTSIKDFNHGVASNFLQSPPLSTKELLFDDVYNNKFIFDAVELYLGKGAYCSFISANTAVANTDGRQPVHKDASFVHPAAPYIAVINFLLDEFTPQNGSTEFWLGSHLSTDASEQIWPSKEASIPTCNVTPEAKEERLRTRPPAQANIPFGSILLRDCRIWHAGMPNYTDNDRIMIAVGYCASWFPQHKPFLAPESAREVLTAKADGPAFCEFIADSEWDQIKQSWGAGKPMNIAYHPDPATWDTVNMLKPEQKYVL